MNESHMDDVRPMSGEVDIAASSIVETLTQLQRRAVYLEGLAAAREAASGRDTFSPRERYVLTLHPDLSVTLRRSANGKTMDTLGAFLNLFDAWQAAAENAIHNSALWSHCRTLPDLQIKVEKSDLPPKTEPQRFCPSIVEKNGSSGPHRWVGLPYSKERPWLK